MSLGASVLKGIVGAIRESIPVVKMSGIAHRELFCAVDANAVLPAS
jgi:hypothetical protein